MAPRAIQVARPCLRHLRSSRSSWTLTRRSLSTSARPQNASTEAEVIISKLQTPVDFVPATKPPSARPIETRKSQLIRTYTSLLRTTPLILFFQHSNLTAVEWAAVRRELKKATEAVSAPAAFAGVDPAEITSKIQIQVMRTNMLSVAMKLVELYNPETAAASAATARTTRGPLVHDLSEAAYQAMRETETPPDSALAQIEPLLVGPVAALTMPTVSPQHLAAALSVLAPVPGKFPAPSRKKNPGYHDPTCQNGLAKLLLVGGRIEDKIFDQPGVNWVGGIEGGIDGLRAQLVGILQGAGLGITNALEGGSRSLWLALEGRKGQLEDSSKPASEESQ